MGKVTLAAFAYLTVAACTAAPASDNQSIPSAAPRAGQEGPAIDGRWRIVEVNGAPPRVSTGAQAPQPYLAFTATSYGGSSGCNSFGGLGLRVGDRWFAEGPMATAIGCGDLTGQESAIFGAVAGGPRLVWDGSDKVELRTGRASLRLVRTGPPEDATRMEPLLLAGTQWEFHVVDGRAIELPGARQPASLTFEADQWTLTTPCGVASGGWRQSGEAVQLDPPTTSGRSCTPVLQRASDSLAAIVGGRLRFRTGPNGELVIAGTDHWLTGRRNITFGADEQRQLAGRWLVASVDGKAPPAAERAPELAFGPGAFASWDGCRHSEGVAIALERKLHMLGSGVVTLANCPADPLRDRMAAVIAAGPRIAKTRTGGIALVSRVGSLRLERISQAPFGTGVERRLRGGQVFDLSAGASGPGRLSIGPAGRFTLALGCGIIPGRWRADSWESAPYARFSPDLMPARCDGEAEARRLNAFFTGDVHVAIGPNRDFALFVNREQGLAARLPRAK